MTKIKDKGFGGKGSKRKLGAIVHPLPPQGEARKGADRKQQCKRLPSTATQAEILAAHKSKMASKYAR